MIEAPEASSPRFDDEQAIPAWMDVGFANTSAANFVEGWTGIRLGPVQHM
jgi:hypothetical protein